MCHSVHPLDDFHRNCDKFATELAEKFLLILRRKPFVKLRVFDVLDGTPTESFGAEQNRNTGGRGKNTHACYIYIIPLTDILKKSRVYNQNIF